MKILAIAAHTDDSEVGIGATLAKFIERGDEIKSIALSWCGNEILIKEFEFASRTLGITDIEIFNLPVRNFPANRQEILDILIKLRDSFLPETVFIPSEKTHQDHFVAHTEALRAFRDHNLYSYEFPWNDWSNKFTCASSITKEHLEKKIEALSKYESQKDKAYFNPEFIRSLAKVRGVQFRCDLCEAFEIIRHKI